MRVLVTGATGRIGSHLVRGLLGAGHDVRAFALPGDPRAALFADTPVEFVYGRLEDPAALAEAVRGVEAICHLAGALTSRGNTDQEFFDLNLRGTFDLLMAARAHAPGLARFLYASSDAVYWSGLSSGAQSLPVDETHPRLAGTIYGASKIGAEELCLTFWRAYGIPATILRFGATVDADELIDPGSVFARWLFLRAAIAHLAAPTAPTLDQVESLAILRQLDTGGEQLLSAADPVGQPEIRQWADARDVADGCLRALTHPAAVGEAFNLGGADPFASDALIAHLANRLGLPSVVARLPGARAPWYISSAKAGAVLGYRPRTSVFDMVDDALAARQNALRARD